MGAQKIVPTLAEAIKRLREHVFPLEDAKMKKEGHPVSVIGKIHIFEREMMPFRKVTMILANERLGFRGLWINTDLLWLDILHTYRIIIDIKNKVSLEPEVREINY